MKYLKELDSQRLLRVMNEYFRDIADDEECPDQENTQHEYPALYTLPRLIQESWISEGGHATHGELAMVGSVFTIVAVRELEKDLQLEQLLGPRE